MFDAICRQALIDLALNAVAVAAAAGDGSNEELDLAEALLAIHPPLARPAAAFVTIYVADQLRGCLGELGAETPLARVVARCSWRAARFDSRFEPIQCDELGEVRVKISVLGPLRTIDGPDDIRIGRDGLLIEHAARRGLLLPEVAADHGWDAPAFLAQLYRKAGIAPHIPLEQCRLRAFHTELIDSLGVAQI